MRFLMVWLSVVQSSNFVQCWKMFMQIFSIGRCQNVKMNDTEVAKRKGSSQEVYPLKSRLPTISKNANTSDIIRL